MPKVRTNYLDYRLQELTDYIRTETKHKKIKQHEMGDLLGRTQASFSMKLSNNSLTASDLLLIFEKLDTPPEKIGELLSMRRG